MVGVLLASSVVSANRHYDRELVPGRLIGLTVGTQTIRYRDHDSCTEYAYSCISGVAVLGDVVVVDLGSGFWSLPMELFDGLGLEVLRARAGRPALGHELWPDLSAGLAAGQTAEVPAQLQAGAEPGASTALQV